MTLLTLSRKTLWVLGLLWLGLFAPFVYAHGVAAGDQAFIEQAKGVQLLPFIYLGAKHMVTGYDHLLFLAGVIFFLYRVSDIAVYVTLFAVGQSVNLLVGVLSGFHVPPYLVDALIGISIVYKALDNMQAFESWFGKRPDPKLMVALFGLIHGFGLASKVQDFTLDPDGLIGNMLAFNLGVELGLLLALGIILILMNFWRLSPSFHRHAFRSNQVLMCASFIFFFYQLTGLFVVAKGIVMNTFIGTALSKKSLVKATAVAAIADTLLDRLLQDSHRIELTGDSMRKLDRSDHLA